MGIEAIAVYSRGRCRLPYVREADQAVLLGPPPPPAATLTVGAVLAAARETRGSGRPSRYGFLSESPEFAARVAADGLTWIGAPSAMEQWATRSMPEPDGAGRRAGRGGDSQPGRRRRRSGRAGPADRLPGHGQGGGGRWRNRDERGVRRAGTAGRVRDRTLAGGRFFAARRSCWSATSPAPGTWKSRSSAWAMAGY